MKKSILIFICAMLFLGANARSKMYKQFADCEIRRFPKAWQFDYGSCPFFGYTQGVGCLAMLKVWKATGEQKYFDYVLEYADSMVLDNGVISCYDHSVKPYNVDMINAGKMLFEVYDQTGNEKYKKAANILYQTMMKHPRNSLGGFWHKEIYPYQMWLDGLYMASPFLAQYAQRNQLPNLTEDVINQLMLVKKYMYNAENGLYYHAWDEKKVQKWCDPQTGLSHIFWGRSIGWLYMALVDVLDFIPQDNPKRGELVSMVRGLADDIQKYQHDGLWYQVVDQPDRTGNYQEASVSSMFMYSIAKAVNRGYLPKSYKKIATRAYNGLTKRLMRVDADGTLNLIQCCAVAGLGGNPYRDGSYEYYINEKIRDNDGKATGPFIMGCLELDK